MLQIPVPALLDADRETLRVLQDRINAVPDYAGRVAAAATAFDAKSDALFKRIRSALAISCGELERCAYCEDSNADEVEHIKPKGFFPELTFTIENYLFACGRCNPIKREKFSVRSNNAWVDLQVHRQVNGVIPPPIGCSRFINPIEESPLEFIWLDIAGGTFFFTEIHEEGTIEFERANYTINTLKLNDRGALVKSRKVAFSGFVDRIYRYLEKKDLGQHDVELRSRLIDIYRTPHQTLRLEIGRQIVTTGLPPNTAVDHPELFQLALPARLYLN